MCLHTHIHLLIEPPGKGHCQPWGTYHLVKKGTDPLVKRPDDPLVKDTENPGVFDHKNQRGGPKRGTNNCSDSEAETPVKCWAGFGKLSKWVAHVVEEWLD
jgi:hypothetical protein